MNTIIRVDLLCVYDCWRKKNETKNKRRRRRRKWFCCFLCGGSWEVYGLGSGFVDHTHSHTAAINFWRLSFFSLYIFLLSSLLQQPWRGGSQAYHRLSHAYQGHTQSLVFLQSHSDDSNISLSLSLSLPYRISYAKEMFSIR